MEVHVETRAGSTIVTPTGDVDLNCSRDLQIHLREVFSKKPERVVVDHAHGLPRRPGHPGAFRARRPAHPRGPRPGPLRRGS